jgi:hypothetical protein
LKASKNKKI